MTEISIFLNFWHFLSAHFLYWKLQPVMSYPHHRLLSPWYHSPRARTAGPPPTWSRDQIWQTDGRRRPQRRGWSRSWWRGRTRTDHRDCLQTRGTEAVEMWWRKSVCGWDGGWAMMFSPIFSTFVDETTTYFRLRFMRNINCKSEIILS